MATTANLEMGETAAVIDEAEAIRAAQQQALARVRPLNMLACMVVSFVVVAVLWDHVPRVSALIWCGVIWCFCLSRLAAWLLRSERGGQGRAKASMIGKTIFNSTLMGTLWGAGGIVLYPDAGGAHQMFLGLVLTGMAAGGAASLAALPAAAVGYLLPLYLPFTVRVTLDYEATHIAAGGVGVLFIAVVLFVNREVHAAFLSNVRMRVANQRLLQDLRATRTDLLDAITSANEALAIFDADNHLIAHNDAYAGILAAPAGALRPGMTFEDLARYSSPPKVADGKPMKPEDWHAWRKQHHYSCGAPFEQLLEDGRWLRTHDVRTRRGGVAVLHVDITAHKEREQALRKAKEEAELANRAKSHFLALMSHELRTPLNAIIGFAEILESETFGVHSDPQYREYAGDIRSAGDHLLKIINDILDLSKIEAGRMELQEEEISVGALIDDVVRLVTTTAERQQLKIEVELPNELPHIYADLRIARQMLLNLLSNAIKFTNAGGRVTVSAECHDRKLAITVADTGIGITEADLPRVLEPFRQIGQSINDHQQGTGLGLPLVKSMIELHGGSFAIASEPGVGTQVTLTFGPERLVAAAA